MIQTVIYMRATGNLFGDYIEISEKPAVVEILEIALKQADGWSYIKEQ